MPVCQHNHDNNDHEHNDDHDDHDDRTAYECDFVVRRGESVLLGDVPRCSVGGVPRRSVGELCGVFCGQSIRHLLRRFVLRNIIRV